MVVLALALAVVLAQDFALALARYRPDARQRLRTAATPFAQQALERPQAATHDLLLEPRVTCSL